MKRSNRLVLLIGIFLAIVAFVLIILMFSNNTGGQNGPSASPTTTKVVVAAKDIPLGTKIQGDMVGLKDIPIDSRPATAFGDTSFVIGKIARTSVTEGGLVDTEVLEGGSGSIVDIEVPAGLVAMSVKVDQTSGVGTVIKTGDYVDAVVAFKIAPIETDPTTGIKKNSDVNYGSSVKALLQGMQVLGTLLPTPAQNQEQPQPTGSTAPGGTTSLNDQQQIVILAVTLQQSEVLNYAQIEGAVGPNGITLVLRSSKDYVDAAGSPSVPPDTLTTGIILSILVSHYGVLPPNLVIAPSPSPVPVASPSASPSGSPSASPSPKPTKKP